MEVYVRKADGRLELFDEAKVRRTLKRIGAPSNCIDLVVEEVKGRIYNGISTKEIYFIIRDQLRGLRHPSSERVRLKEAMMLLGPSGFKFEGFIAELFEKLGYKTRSDVVLKGKCVNHEIDVLLNDNVIVECKYHSQAGIYTGLKEALYTAMRGIDLMEAGFNVEEIWLVTNTKFSREAKEFAKCRGMKLLGWREPENRGLEDIIEEFKLYPITMLSTVTNEELNLLAMEKVYTLSSLISKDIRNIREDRLRELKEEARKIVEKG